MQTKVADIADFRGINFAINLPSGKLLKESVVGFKVTKDGKLIKCSEADKCK
jgi:hypothetical protein